MASFSPADLSFLASCDDEDDSLVGLESYSQGDIAAGLIDEIGFFGEGLNRNSSLSRTISGGGSCPKSLPLLDEIGGGFSCGDLGRANSLSVPAPFDCDYVQEKNSLFADLKFDIQAAALSRVTSLGPSCAPPLTTSYPPPVLSVPQAPDSNVAPPGAEEVVFVACVGPDGQLLTRVWDGFSDLDQPVMVVPPVAPLVKAESGRRTSKVSRGRVAPAKPKVKSPAGHAGEDVVVENGDLWTAIQTGLGSGFFVPLPPTDIQAATQRQLCRHRRSGARARLEKKRSIRKLVGEKRRHYPERQAAATTRKRVGGRFQKENKASFTSVTEIGIQAS